MPPFVEKLPHYLFKARRTIGATLFASKSIAFSTRAIG